MRYALLGPACAFVLGAGFGHSYGLGAAEGASRRQHLCVWGCGAFWTNRQGWALICFRWRAGGGSRVCEREEAVGA